MRRHDVPEQHVVGDSELAQDAVHDRRRRLGRPGAGQLPLGRERHTAHARPAVAGRFTDEHDRHARALGEVRVQPLAAQPGASVLVVRRSDACAREPLD